MIGWEKIEGIVKASEDFILTDDEQKLIKIEEQTAYEKNLPDIISALNLAENQLKKLGFWVESSAKMRGLRFRFSLRGYYGPGGFSTHYHVSGPLVLGVINPAGDQYASFYPNDIDKCFLMGLDFDKSAFENFLIQQVEKYLQPENLITSKEQYDRFRALLSDK